MKGSITESVCRQWDGSDQWYPHLSGHPSALWDLVTIQVSGARPRLAEEAESTEWEPGNCTFHIGVLTSHNDFICLPLCFLSLPLECKPPRQAPYLSCSCLDPQSGSSKLNR